MARLGPAAGSTSATRRLTEVQQMAQPGQTGEPSSVNAGAVNPMFLKAARNSSAPSRAFHRKSEPGKGSLELG